MTICIIAIAVCIIFLHVIERMCGKSLVEINRLYSVQYSWQWRMEARAGQCRKGKGKKFMLLSWAMDMEKNFMNSLDREENKPFSFGRRETQKITWSDNPLIKVFWPRHESKKVTGMGHYAWTSCRTKEAGKTTDAMAWQHQGSNRPMIGRPKRSSTR